METGNMPETYAKKENYNLLFQNELKVCKKWYKTWKKTWIIGNRMVKLKKELENIQNRK